MTDRTRLLEMALKGLEADRARLDTEIAEIRRELRHGSHESSEPAGLPKRRTMSAAARKRISEGMKRRYAALRGLAEPASARKQMPAVVLTAAGRKKLSDMMKARWAAKKKAGKKAA